MVHTTLNQSITEIIHSSLRLVQHGRSELYALERFYMENKGWGIRTSATCPIIPSGTYIGEYIGEVISSSETQTRSAAQGKDGMNFILSVHETLSDGTSNFSFSVVIIKKFHS